MKKVALLSMTVLSFCGVNVHADKAVPAAHEKPATGEITAKPAAKDAALAPKAVVVKTAPTKSEEQKPATAKPPEKPADTKAATPSASVVPPPQEDTTYNAKNYVGVPILDASGKLSYVAENPSQTHSKDDYIMVLVKGIDVRKNEKGRVRVAMWSDATNYAKEGVKPYRASSHWAKDAVNGEMLFKIGVDKAKGKFSIFVHFDKEDRGFVKRVFGIPVDPYLFSNAKKPDTGPGLTREGLSPPKFENTVITYKGPGQKIIMDLHPSKKTSS